MAQSKDTNVTLKESVDRLRLAIQAGKVGLWDWDLRTNTVQFSTEWKEQIGYEDHEVSNDFSEWQSRIHPDDLDRALNTTRAYLEKPWPDYKIEYRIRHKDGAYRWVLGQASLEFDANGKPVHMLGSQVDITDRKLAEAELKTSEERLKALFNRASEGIVLLKPSGELVAANEAFARMHGYTPQEMLNVNLKDLDTPEGRRMIPERMQHILSGKPLTFEVENYHKDGHVILMEVSASLIIVDGEPFIQSFSRNITERKESENKIRFLTRIYATQSQASQALIESKDETTLFNRVCQLVVESAGMELAWIGVNDEKSGLIKPVAAYGNQTDYLDNLVVSSREDIPEGRGPSGIAFRENRSIFVQDFKTNPMLAAWPDRIRLYGWGSSGTVPLIRGGKAYAVLVFYHTDEHVFTDEIVALCNEMGVNIGRGLDRFDLEAEKLKAEESMRLAAKIYESSTEAVMVTDENNRIVDVNPAFTRITGYTVDEVVGRNPNILQSGKHDDEFYRTMWQALQNDGHWQGEIWDRRKNGELYTKWVSINVIRHADGSVYRHVAQISDITERKEHEQELRKFKDIIESTDDAIISKSLTGMIESWNKGAEKIFGYTAQEVIGRPIEILIPPEYLDDESEIQARIVRGESVDQHEMVRRHKDGRQINVSTTTSPILDDQGKVIGASEITRDITQRKLTEEELSHHRLHLEELIQARTADLTSAREEADRANQSKSEFLSSMSHELRTPMNAILGFSQLMAYDSALPEELKDHVQEVLKAGHHLLELINEVLDLARVESGHVDLSLEPVEVCSIIDECIMLLRTLADKRGIKLSHRGLEGMAVRADRTRFKQALLNLLSNAIKYNREGGSVRIEVQRKGKDRLRIRVSDTGPGITAAQLKELFQPFNRLGAENSNIEGTGIGLTITRRLIEMMGGSVEVESEVGVGSTFWIELPIEALPEAERGDHHAAADGAMSAQHIDAARHLVLYIEDNPSNLKLMAQILGRRQHIRLITAHTPKLGVELALALQPELILLDINMPHMDGYQVLKIFQSEASLKSIPVVAITANAMLRDIERGKRAGFSAYLTKPLDIAELFRMLDRYLLDRTENEI